MSEGHDMAALFEAVESGAEVEVFPPSDGGLSPGWCRVSRLRRNPLREGRPAEVEVHLQGAGFVFAGPGALPVRWRRADG